MDQIELDVARRGAGAEYLEALRTLGLDPDALLWSFDQVEDRFVLLLVTRMVDFKGPLAVSHLLFKAYNASATPKGIDPFVVRLHSPDQAIVRDLAEFATVSVRVAPILAKGHRPARDDSVPATPILTTGGMVFRQEWIYAFKTSDKRPSSITLMRQWRRFSGKVGHLPLAA